MENVNSLLTTIPSSTTIVQKGDDAVKVVVANFEEIPIFVSITASSTDGDLNCGFLDGKDIVSTIGPFDLESGDQRADALIVLDKGGPIRLTSCKVSVTGDDTGDTTVVIKIEKKQGGIFG